MANTNIKKLLHALQTRGEEMFSDWQKENREMISYNAWESRVILELIERERKIAYNHGYADGCEGKKYKTSYI